MTNTVEQEFRNDTGLVSTSSHYRSRVSTVNHSINPLVAAASPIFSIINQLQQKNHIANLQLLHEKIVDEIITFESTVRKHDYLDKTIQAARYALCSFVDEQVQITLGSDNQDQWRPYLILKRFHNNEWGGQQFFILLERSTSDSFGYVDLLEIFYLCLALGYQGKYKNSDQGFIIRENIINKLYQCIRQNRGDFSKNVLISANDQGAHVTPIKKKRYGVLALNVAAVITVISIVTSTYFSFQTSNKSLQSAMTNVLHTKLETSHFTKHLNGRDSNEVY